MSRKQQRQKKVAQWEEGKLRGIVINRPYGACGVCLEDHMVDFMQQLHPDWEESDNEADVRTDQKLVGAMLKHPDKFISRFYSDDGQTFTEKSELSVVFVDPTVIEAKAWRVNSYDGAESISVLPECIALWKIRCLATDPEIIKLATVKNDQFWFWGHVAE